MAHGNRLRATHLLSCESLLLVFVFVESVFRSAGRGPPQSSHFFRAQGSRSRNSGGVKIARAGFEREVYSTID